MIGWGRVEYNGDLPGRLQEARLRILSQHECRHETRYLPVEITDNMICAGHKTGLIDACQVDELCRQIFIYMGYPKKTL